MESLLLLIRASAPAKKEIRLVFGVAACILLPLTAVLVVTSIGTFIRPGALHYDDPGYFNNEYAYYCTYWAMRNAHISQPAPTLCDFASISSAVLVSDNMPYAGNKYAYGNCTYWAAMRRAQVGKPIPNTWGNAAQWAGRASGGGYIVDHTPSLGAIMQTPNTAGGLGHVAFVEGVDPGGTWHISEMNAIGFNKVDYKTLPASTAAGYSFIH
jgi:hypothetical protein